MKRSAFHLAGFTALWLALAAQAMPPRQHPLHGAVQTIEGQQLTLNTSGAANGAARPLMFSDRTRFYENGKRTSAAALRAGLRVSLYYRNEPGRAFITEARWVTDGAPLPATRQGGSIPSAPATSTHGGTQL